MSAMSTPVMDCDFVKLPNGDILPIRVWQTTKVKQRPKVVFISGPCRAPTEWGVKQNIHAAELAAMHVWQLGGVALCQHANTAFFGGACPDETWLAGDMELLRRCDAVYAMVDWRQSKGASAEVELAESMGLPVFSQGNVTSERELAAFLRGE
jgi:hypothetical protein